MSKPVRTRDLMTVLQRLGFSQTSGKGSHTLMRHDKTGLLITLPTERDEIPPVYLASVKRQLSNYGIASDERLQKMLQERLIGSV